MASKNNTREGIHSGLSQSKSDEKWFDMLNFRCSDNRTFVVPRRLGLLNADAGFHTVLHGVGDLNYAIGSKKSFVFRGHDETVFGKLWRARLERQTTTEDQSENLKIRGSYTGANPINIRLTVVDGLLVLDSNWPVEPEVVEETPYVPVLNCNSGSGTGVMFNIELLYLPFLTEWGISFKSYPQGHIGSWDADSFNYIALEDVTMSENYDMSDHYSRNFDSPTTGRTWCRVFVWADGEGTSSGWDSGMLAHHNGVIYKCIQNHWDQSGMLNYEPEVTEPGVGSGWGLYWVEFSLISDPEPEITIADDYLVDAVVRNGNAIYKCLVQHSPLDNGTEPGVGVSWETYWEDITDESWLPANAAEVTIYQGTSLFGNFVANANGLLSVLLPVTFYTFTASYPDHADTIVDVTIDPDDPNLTISIL